MKFLPCLKKYGNKIQCQKNMATNTYRVHQGDSLNRPIISTNLAICTNLHDINNEFPFMLYVCFCYFPDIKDNFPSQGDHMCAINKTLYVLPSNSYF